MTEPAPTAPRGRTSKHRSQLGRTTVRRLMLLAAGALALASLTTGFVAQPIAEATSGPASVPPNPVNNMDCNGYSATYKALAPGLRSHCTDPINIMRNNDGASPAHPKRFEDNGHYVGHDEPTVRFESTTANSGNTMTYYMQIPTDPMGKPSTSPTGTITSDYAQLSVAPWFGLPICDPNSYPAAGGSAPVAAPCTRDSDSNHPASAGSAFMELQFYAPGYGPFIVGPSCDPTRWCSALNIDSLTQQCTVSGCTQNPSCVEPINFAYLTRDGVPTGPPSPQLANVSTLTPNADTLYMNPGDTVKVSITDTSIDPALPALETSITDYTTGQSGFIIASAANGFKNTNPDTCAGTPFNFHAMYNTSVPANTIAWSALEGGVLMQQEIGHGETCSSVSSSFPVSMPGYSDPNIKQVCTSGLENGESRTPSSTTGEGPCVSGTCTGATTEGNAPCPAVATLCEFSDAYCMPAGPRHVTVNGADQLWDLKVAQCGQNAFQNGDLDFDGNTYIPDWPDGSNAHPTSFRYLGPFDPTGLLYPNLQFQTDGPGSEQACDPNSGAGCTVPPPGSAFYPYWSINNTRAQGLAGLRGPSSATPCVWNFGGTTPGVTDNTFSGDSQYGSPDLAHYGGNLLSAQMANPANGGSNGAASNPTTCTAITESQLAYAPFNSMVQVDRFSNVFTIPPAAGTPTSTTALSTTIARGVALTHAGMGGYVLDGTGKVSAFGGANPTVHTSAFWPGWDIARGIVLLGNDHGGYVLDGWGGVWPFAVGANPMPPKITAHPYWRGYDIARGIVLTSGGTSGYVLDGWGAVHSIGGAPVIHGGPSWPGWDIARGFVLNPDEAGGYVLDGWGGVHTFGVARPVPMGAYWPGWDIARSIVTQPGTVGQGWVLDGWGGIHAFGDAPRITATSSTSYTPGKDIHRALAAR